MRKTTIVVAILAATVAAASAAPSSSSSLRSGTSFQSKPSQPAQAQPSRPLGATAFTSARNAGAAQIRPAPQAGRSAVPAPSMTPRAAERSAQARGARVERRPVASARNLRARNSAVALSRDVPIDRMTRPAAQATARAPSGSIHDMVTAEAQRAGVSPSLGHAVVKVESMYNPRATGKGGYIGLMQLSYQTAKGMGYRGSRAGLYEPSTNLRYGMRYLAQANAKAGGSTCATVSKYQGGHAVRGVTRAGSVYCGKVRRYMASR